MIDTWEEMAHRELIEARREVTAVLYLCLAWSRDPPVLTPPLPPEPNSAGWVESDASTVCRWQEEIEVKFPPYFCPIKLKQEMNNGQKQEKKNENKFHLGNHAFWRHCCSLGLIFHVQRGKAEASRSEERRWLEAGSRLATEKKGKGKT